MATPAHKSIHEDNKNVLMSPWKGKLTIKNCVLCDITLWSTSGTVIPAQLPHILDFRYVIRVSSLKEKLPEAALRKQIYLEERVCSQDVCFNFYDVELSNKQRKEVDKLIEYVENKQLAIIKCLEDREIFILLSSSALIPEPGIRDEQMGLCALHLFHSPLATEVRVLKTEDDISWKLVPILPALNYALLEAKKLLPEERTHPNVLVKHNFQELFKVPQNLSLTDGPQDGETETTFCEEVSSRFDMVLPTGKCSMESLTQLKSYFSDPSGYTLEVSTALNLLGEHPPSPYISDGICDAGFSLVMTPDPEFLDSEAEVRKKPQMEKNSEEMFKSKKAAVVPLSAASNLRIRPKRKASMLPIVPSKRVNLCRPFAKIATPGTDRRSYSPPTLKLVKGQFPQKRKRGAEVLTAQFVQKSKLNRKNQEVPISKDVPVTTNAKRVRRQEKSPVKTVRGAKPPLKKSPQRQRVNIVKGNENPRTKKQLKPAKEETALRLQSEISSDGQKDGISINTAQPQSTTKAQKDLPGNSTINYDSQALNMLADLALSSAASPTPLREARNLPCSSELPQNDALLDSSLRGTSDHEYHRGVKSQKGVLLPKSSCDQKSNSGPDLTVSQEENFVPCSQKPANAQSALHKETLQPMLQFGASQNTLIIVEHSYALLLGEHSKKRLQQRGLPGPAFTKNGIKGPDARTPVGKVMPFRHLQHTSPLQKLTEDSLVKRRGRFVSSNLKSIFCSHMVVSSAGSIKITFKCEAEYAFNLDSRYTNNPLEKTVVRALHGPWNINLPDNLEETKLVLHMWVALLHKKRNEVVQSSRKVVEHSNPAKYVSLNSTLECFELSEIEESSSVERCLVEPLLEINEMPRGHAGEVSFRGPNSLLPLIKLPSSRGLELCVQNEQKEIFATEYHADSSESQNFIYSCNNEVIGGKAEEESTDKLEASNLFSVTGNTQTNGPFISDEDAVFQSLDSKRMVSYNNTGTQPTFTKTYSESSSQPEMCEKSVYSHPESRVDNLHLAVQTNTSVLKDVIQHSHPVHSECQSSLERTNDNMEYVVINLEPVTFTVEKNACVPVHTKVSRVENLTAFSSESMKKVLPATNAGHTLSLLEETKTESVRDIPSLAVSGQKSTLYLSASSGKRETLDEECLSLQKEMPLPISSPSYDKALIMEALSLVKHSSYPSPSEEIKHSQDVRPQAQNLFSISSEEIIEPSHVDEVLPSVSASLGKRYSHDPISQKSNVSDDSLELKKNKSSLSCENMNLESFSSVFTEQTDLSMNGQEVSLELQEENSDIDLTLTISPPRSPRGKVPAKEADQLQEAPGSNVGLQDIVEEIAEPEVMTLIEKREVNSASAVSSYSTMSKEPLENKEREGDSLQPVTLILPKQNCTLDIGEKISVTSDFPFNSLIEEVSPASSPDPLIPTKETWSSQNVPQSSLKLHGTQCEKSNKFSQTESEDLAITEKENSFIGPNPLVGGENLTRLPTSQLSAQMPLILTNHPRKNGRLMLTDKTTEEITLSEHSEGLSFSDKVQSHDPELNSAALVASYGNNFKPSLEKRVKSGNPLQLINRESEDLSLKHLVLESDQPPFSSRKTIENESLADTLVSTTAVSGTMGISLKEQGSPESIKRSLHDSDLKTDGDSCIQVKFLNSASADEIDAKQAHLHQDIPELGSASDSDAFTQCTRPESIELGFQTQEISVITVASLLGNSKTETELHQKGTDLGTTSLQSNSTAFTESAQTVHTLVNTSKCEIKELSNNEFLPSDACSYKNTTHINENISEEPFAVFGPESVETLIFGDSEEYIDRKNASERPKNDVDSAAMGRIDMSMNPDIHCELISGDSDEDSLDDYRNPKLDMENSSIFRSYTRKNEHATEDDYDSLSSLNSDNEACDYSNDVQGLEISSPPSSWATGLEKDKCVPRYVQIRDFCGIPRNYDNFTVRREFKDLPGTLHRVKRCPRFTINWGLLSSWTSTWQVTDNPTQNTLDLEYLRFTHKIKQVVKKGGSQQPDLPLQISLRDFPLTKISEPLVLHPTPRSRSPILVTVLHSDANFSQQESQHKKSRIPSDVDSTTSFCKEGCSHHRNLTDSQRNQTVSFHLNKLKYNSTSKESRNDISLILNEYAEFNKVIMKSHLADLQDKELSRASEEAIYQEMNPSFQRQSTSYEDIVTDLCTSLHTKLNSVLKKACKSPFFFYLVETEDKLFFSRTKSILRKGGHTETEPQHFCQALHRMLDTLVVIIRNEDISSHLHQIPSLLMLKHLPGVIFAGVDDPEDVLNDTHQELFRTGGFVVSDDRILETITLAQLKEIVKILEKLNGHGRWKWLLHYRENKKLKEGLRMDSVAHKKNLILRSYQSANIIELLPYHHCDSESQTKADSLKCLINLQIQHVDARFAIFLTDKHISSEVFGNNGILATDINHFIENIQKVAAPFRSSYW